MRSEQVSGRRGLRALVRPALIALLVSFLGVEIVARFMTGTAKNGMPAISRFPLLPYRPPIEFLADKRTDEEPAYIAPDEELGWTVKPNGSTKTPGNSEELLYQSNPQGIRCSPERVFADTPPAGRVRVVTVGDSFTHCDDVPNSDTWQHQLELIRSDVEVANLGVPGYGSDQAWLRWRRDGRALNGDIALLGIWPEDICRHLNVVRYFMNPTGSFVSKPRFTREGETLRLVNAPVIRGAELDRLLAQPDIDSVLAHDYWFRPHEVERRFWHASRALRSAHSIYNLYQRKREREAIYSGANPLGIEVTVAIAREFSQQVRAAGQIPIVLIIPMQDLLPLHTAVQPFPLVAALREAGIEVIDLGPSFGQELLQGGVDKFYVHRRGHHNAAGNRALAEQLAKELEPYVQLALSN